MLALTFLVLSAASRAIASDAAPSSQRASLWGPVVKGVQSRLFMATEIEQDALIPIRFDIADDPAHLPPGMDRFDTFLLDTRVVLSLTNIKTKKSVIVRPPVPENGIPTVDSGNDFVRLDGSEIKPFQMNVALRSARATLEPGEYDCVLSCPIEANRPQWLIQPVPPGDGWWSGRFETTPLRIKIVPATAKTRSLSLPKNAYLAKSQLNTGFELRCDKLDVEAVDVPVRNGCYLGARISREGGASELTGDAISLPAGGLIFDDPTDPKVKVKAGEELTYTVEVFETARPAEHHWMPVPGQDEYKSLWTRSFKVKVPELPQR